MPNFIKNLKEAVTLLHGNLLFEHFGNFQTYSTFVCKKVKSQFFLEKEFRKKNGHPATI